MNIVVTTILLVLILVVSVVALIIIILRLKSFHPVDIQKNLQDFLTSLLNKQMQENRDVFEKSFREHTSQQQTVQVDIIQKMMKQNEEARTNLQDSITSRFDELSKRQTESLRDARKSQDERLDRVDEGLKGITAEFKEARTELVKEVLEMTSKQMEKSTKSFEQLNEKVGNSFDALSEKLAESQSQSRRELADSLKTFKESVDTSRESQAKSIADFQTAVDTKLTEHRKSQEEHIQKLQEQISSTLDKMRKDNEDSLEKMRATVDEKLQSTLETRLGESFKQVSERLEQVHKGLGEMQTLASGVGDLKKVLTNVRSRGTFGEVQLGAILEQVFTPTQYETNCAVKPGSNERVEFAIKLPGRDDTDSVVYLPIDAKFPQEDYQRLLEAYEATDQALVESARKALRTRLIQEAQTIQSKYISPPDTTDFALMFVPTESLYAEALRIPGLTESLQTKNRVILVGPTNLYAVLNSLQMGFRTLAIQKRSSEVWKVLGAVKTEFGKFGNSLQMVSKKLREASNKIEDTERRTRVMERKLKTVEALPEEESIQLLPDSIEADTNDEEPTS